MRGNAENQEERDPQDHAEREPEDVVLMIPHTLTPFREWAGRLLQTASTDSITAPSDFVNPAGRRL